MADNGQIDNIYLNFEVGGNADEKLDGIYKDLENIENGVNDVEKAFESFANVSKIDVLRKKISNVSKDLDEAASKNKGLEDKGVLNDLTKRFSLNDKLAKEELKVAQVTVETEAEWASVLEKVSTEEGRLALKIEQVTKATLEQMAQHKLNAQQISRRAEQVTKLTNKLEKLRMATKQDALKALDWQIPDVSLGDEQRANLERIIATAEGGSNAFDKMGMAMQEAEANLSSFSIDRLLTDEGKLDKLQGELVETTAKLRDLLNSGGKYSSKDVDSLVNQIHRLEREIDKTKSKIQKSTIDLMSFATKPTAPMSRWQRILNSISGIFSKIGSIGSKAFEKIRKSTKKANNSSRGYQKGLRGLLGTAKRFLIFGTFFTIQRQISQAFSEGTQNLYQYSKAIDGTFAKSMDRLATSFLYMKNAIGAAVAPIINAVTPALESLIDTVAEFGNKLAETFAALTGATTFKKAIKSHKEYAEAVNKTNNALAKFDEINNITTSKGDKNQDYDSMFEVADVKISVSNFGEALAKGFNRTIENLKTKIGKTDFSALAGKLTTNLQTMIRTINWGNIGGLFSELILGAFDFIGGLVDWLSDPLTINDASNAIIEFVRAIEWEKISKELITLLTKILSPMTWINVTLGLAKITFGIFIKDEDLKILDKVYNDLTNFFKKIGDIFSYMFKNMFSKDFWANPQPVFGEGGFFQKKPKWLEKFQNIFGFANGGYPESGQIFLARENGIPEMVGSIGSRTAVANSGQIVEAVSIGVYNAVVDAMSRSGGNKQPTIVQINGREVFRAVQDESTAYSRRTGQPAF